MSSILLLEETHPGAKIRNSRFRFYQEIISDYEALRGISPKLRNIISSFIFNPGFKSVIYFRLQMLAQSYELMRIAQLISNLNLRVTGAEFCVGASIDSGLIIRHPNGIVIGGTVTIGKNCILSQGVTVGQRYLDNFSATSAPNISSNVKIGANATILGNIQLAEGTTVGAHSLVMTSTARNQTYVGVPARMIVSGSHE